MRIVVLALLFTCMGCATSLSHRETYIDAEKFTPGGRSQILANQDEPGSQVSIVANTDLFKYGYWDNRVWGLTNQSKFSATGWEYRLGAHLAPMLDIEYRHHSQHRLDEKFGPNEGHPVEDSIGIKLFLYRRDRGTASIIK